MVQLENSFSGILINNTQENLYLSNLFSSAESTVCLILKKDIANVELAISIAQTHFGF